MLNANTVPILSEPRPKVRAYDIQPVIPGPCLGVVVGVWVRLGGVAEWGLHSHGRQSVLLTHCRGGEYGDRPYTRTLWIARPHQVGHTGIHLSFRFCL